MKGLTVVLAHAHNIRGSNLVSRKRIVRYLLVMRISILLVPVTGRTTSNFHWNDPPRRIGRISENLSYFAFASRVGEEVAMYSKRRRPLQAWRTGSRYCSMGGGFDKNIIRLRSSPRPQRFGKRATCLRRIRNDKQGWQGVGTVARSPIPRELRLVARADECSGFHVIGSKKLTGQTAALSRFAG